MNQYVDLHIHTCCSDGSSSMEEVFALARENDIQTISITDHDSIEHINKQQILAQKSGVHLIPGVEVSSLYEQIYIHILGYDIDPENALLLELCRQNREAFSRKDDIFVDNLIQLGYRINKKEYQEYQNDPKKGGWKVLNYLIQKGLCEDIYDFLDTYQPGGVLPFAKLSHPKQAIETIHKAGGKAVLAHPESYLSESCQLEDILMDFLRLGIDGIECYTFKNLERTTEYCVDFCKKNKLLITGGSDFHGEFGRKKSAGLAKMQASKLSIHEFRNNNL